ncbi:hypothetical protein [Pedobacter sp. SYSU D00535]|uniref:hypothetical protein n=1 Tax=Pedobacter sp. SYSU D00535 TaxID=2810308 RepID=UPI001A9795B5|nr:hypothetical protein [Pedobacter sp. SYSU D00535]
MRNNTSLMKIKSIILSVLLSFFLQGCVVVGGNWGGGWEFYFLPFFLIFLLLAFLRGFRRRR